MGLGRPLDRRAAVAALVGVLLLAGLAAAIWAMAGREATPAKVAAAELRDYPPILLLWGEAQHATHTATADVYVARADGTGVRRLRAWPDELKEGQVYGASTARWSPDRRQIGVLLGWWCGDPCFTLARLSPDGANLKKLAVRADVFHAYWSSDWHALLTTFGGDLWRAPMDGGKAVPIRHSPDSAGLGEADWSPNSRHFVIATQGGIVKLRRDGKKAVTLTRRGLDVAPRWSPDGRAIAFVRQPGCFYESVCNKPSDVYLVQPEGQGLRQVTSDADVVSFDWSPDGRSILFTSDRSTETASRFDIGVVGADGEGLRTLTSGRRDTALGWAPDGSKILFARTTTRGDGLWVMDADGDRPTRLLGRPGWAVLSADWG